MAQSRKPRVASLDHLVLTVADIMTTRRFYEDVLGMESTSFEAADGTLRWALSSNAPGPLCSRSSRLTRRSSARSSPCCDATRAWRPSACR